MNPDTQKKRKPANHTFDSSNTRHNIKRMLAALVEPRIYEQLAAMLHMSDRSVRFYVKHLRQKPDRRVRVRAYLPIPNGYVAQIALGSLPDAPKPPKKGDKERNAAYRAKVKATPELRERQRRHEVARWAVKKARKSPQNWASALLGAAVREVRHGR